MSCINCPGNRLFDIVMSPLNKMDMNNPYSILNTTQVIKDIKQISLKPNDILLSFDVVSMFTAISPELALNIIIGNGITKYTSINLELFCETFRFLTQHATEFKFEDKLFKQINGLPMGAKGSPCIASIVLTFILNKTLAKHPPVTFIRKYVDDIICITSKENALDILYSLNSFDPSIKFTMELEENSKINFLDVTLIRKSDFTIGSKWFCKTYASNRLVNFYSEHEPHTIKNTAIQYVRNMLFYSDKEYHAELIGVAQNILQLNSFPESFALECIYSAYDLALTDLNSGPKNQDKINEQIANNDELDKNYVSTLAPNKLLHALNKCSRDNNSNVKLVNSFTYNNSDSMIFAHLKSNTDIEYKNNIIVQLSCKSCKFKCIEPIIHPLILYKIKLHTNLFHPYKSMMEHSKRENHTFSTKILKQCSSVPDTLKNTELLCRQNKIRIPSIAHNQLNEASLSFVE